MTFNYFDNASFIGKKQRLGINNLSSLYHNDVVMAAGARWVSLISGQTTHEYSFTVPTGVTQVSAVCVGGGGGGSASTSGIGGNGTVNTGSGGGASCTSNGGGGGSGIVVIRYKFQ